MKPITLKSRCPQCGKQYRSKPCGPTHAAIRNNPSLAALTRPGRKGLEITDKMRLDWLMQPNTEIFCFTNNAHRVEYWRAVVRRRWTRNGPWHDVYDAPTKNGAIRKALKAAESRR